MGTFRTLAEALELARAKAQDDTLIAVWSHASSPPSLVALAYRENAFERSVGSPPSAGAHSYQAGLLDKPVENDPEFATIDDALRHARTLQRANVPIGVWTGQRDASDLVCLVYGDELFAYRFLEPAFYRFAAAVVAGLSLLGVRWATFRVLDVNEPSLRRVGFLAGALGLGAILLLFLYATFARRVPYWIKGLFRS